MAAIVTLTPKRQAEKTSAILSGKTAVSLTFNVYQGTKEIERIIDILSSYGVSATFFLGGCWVAKNEGAVKKLVEGGFEIGTHGYYHYDHAKLSYDQNLTEITKSIEVLNSCGVEKVNLFAPPSGSYGDACVKAVNNLNLTMVLWSIDTIDWRDQDVDLITDRVLNKVEEGDIILMHPTSATVDALPKIIEGILSKNLKILPVSENA